MTLPAWPAAIAARMRRSSGGGDWQLSPIVEIASTDFDQGPARRRRRFTAMRYQLAGRMVLTDAELRVFKGFFYGTLLQGAQKFTMPIWDGEGCITATVRFDATEPYTATQFAPGRVQVTLKLEVFDLPVYDEASAAFIAEYSEADALAWSASLQTWVNVTYPAAVAPYR